MGRAFNSLERVINLEAKQGYQDKAVVGGIRQFVAFWISQAKEEASGEQDLALIEQIAEVMADYGRLPGVEAREKAINNIKTRLQARQQRVGVEQPATEPVKVPASQPKPERKKAPSAAAPKIKEPREPVEPDPEALRQSVSTIRGVGPKIAAYLEKLGVSTIWDLLYIFPRRYDDYTQLKPLNRLVYGDQVTVIGTVWQVSKRRTRNVELVQAVVNDGTGQVQATWFNQPWLVSAIKAGMQIVISGKVDQFLGRPVFNNPEWEALEIEPLKTRRIVPVYPLTKGLTAQKMREIQKQVARDWAPKVPDALPETIRKRRGFYQLPGALRQIHFPESSDSLHHARRRLIFDEMLLLQLGMMSTRRDWQAVPGTPVPTDGSALDSFLTSLPFELTGAQEKVLDEIAADMARNVPMNRLLQGDVGSGKTVVAAAAMALTVHAGYQAAMMAPTEILAEQHYQGLRKMLGGLGITLELLTGSTSSSEKQRIYQGISSGEIQVVVGTHALIQDAVQFRQLVLAVVDEQHRFGVDQRKALREKGNASDIGADRPNPHMLVMSATPIPRSLALSLYGDLDLSVIDELPPGRQEIKTRWLKHSERERAYAFVRNQIEQGRQAFVICPLVEESDKIDAKSAIEEHTRLQKQVFPELKLGLIHGRLTAEEKERAMRAFYEGDTHILVATSVIEVGIDVPNSTVMMIEGANRFGLAQLHQFRGRVGRGAHQSYCLLVADSATPDAAERLSALEKTNDGFILAEKDLELRGPGEFLGRKQSGLPELQLASLTDLEMLTIARQESRAIMREDPYLEQPQHELLRSSVARFWENVADMS